jgi:hypothetical protein
MGARWSPSYVPKFEAGEFKAYGRPYSRKIILVAS